MFDATYSRIAIHHPADWLVVEVVDVDPLDPLTAIFLLLLPQYQLHKELLEFLVAIVDAKLFKTEANRPLNYS